MLCQTNTRSRLIFSWNNKHWDIIRIDVFESFLQFCLPKKDKHLELDPRVSVELHAGLLYEQLWWYNYASKLYRRMLFLGDRSWVFRDQVSWCQALAFKWFGTLCMYVVSVKWFWPHFNVCVREGSHTTRQFLHTSWCSSVQLNSNIIYSDTASDSIGYGLSPTKPISTTMYNCRCQS